MFCTAVALLAVPLLTPCGSISIPLKIVQNASVIVAGGEKKAVLPPDHNNVANTPPLRVIQHASLSRGVLISDADATPAQQHRNIKPLKAAANAAGDTLLFAAVMVDPILGGAGDGTELDYGGGLDFQGIAKPRNPRGSVQIMKSPQVELHGYKIYCWRDKSAPCGIGRARVDSSAKVHVKESGGHEYFALADKIHYHAQRHELIMEGANFLLRCGGQTIRSDKPVLARLDVMTRTLEVSGACSITTSPHHD